MEMFVPVISEDLQMTRDFQLLITLLAIVWHDKTLKKIEYLKWNKHQGVAKTNKQKSNAQALVLWKSRYVPYILDLS
jgi:uncharacterized protein YeaC (DUF1315 family)